jgi:hypothetical protein
MAYRIECLKCGADTWVGNTARLIEEHTDQYGRFLCGQCQKAETYIRVITGRWEREPNTPWAGVLKGVIGVAGDSLTTPYAWLCSESPAGEVKEVRLSYYRISEQTGHIVEEPGPGSAVVLTHDEFRQLLVRIGVHGFFRSQELEAVARLIRMDEIVPTAA